MESWIQLLVALGGFESVKFLLSWWFNRKTNARVADAKADGEEFHVMKEVNTFLQEQLKQKEERFAEQTQIVRQQNMEILTLTKKITLLETERSLKLCERRNCADRQPQSGY